MTHVEINARIAQNEVRNWNSEKWQWLIEQFSSNKPNVIFNKPIQHNNNNKNINLSSVLFVENISMAFWILQVKWTEFGEFEEPILKFIVIKIEIVKLIADAIHKNVLLIRKQIKAIYCVHKIEGILKCGRKSWKCFNWNVD